MSHHLVERFRDWLEARGWWYGRLKPCDCPRSERYWGLATHPSGCEHTATRAEPTTRETNAAVVTEFKRVDTYRCRECGVEFGHPTGVTVGRRTEFDDGTVKMWGVADD